MANQLELRYDADTDMLRVTVRAEGMTDLHVDVTPVNLKEALADAYGNPGERVTR